MKAIRLCVLVVMVGFIITSCATKNKTVKVLWPCEEVAFDNADRLCSFGLGTSIDINSARSIAQEKAMQDLVNKMVNIRGYIQAMIYDTLHSRIGLDCTSVSQIVKLPLELEVSVENSPSKCCEEVLQRDGVYYCCVALEIPMKSVRGILRKSLKSSVEYECELSDEDFEAIIEIKMNYLLTNLFTNN